MKTGNEIIAEFMGWERYSGSAFKCPNVYPIQNSLHAGWTTFTADQFQFHTSWDWLMPVVEKIESLGDSDKQVFDSAEFHELMELSIKTTITRVYYFVITFIKWYNSSKESISELKEQKK